MDYRNIKLKFTAEMLMHAILQGKGQAQQFEDTLLGKLLTYNEVNFGLVETGLQYTDLNKLA